MIFKLNYLNNTIVSELKLIMEDDINFLFSAYIEDCTVQLVDLARSISEHDSDKTRRIAHSLKGSSRNVGASVFSDFCERLEKDAREKSIDTWEPLLKEIESCFIETRNQIQKEILLS